MAVNLHTTHYRFGIDELAESTHGWHANEDANPAQGVIAVNANFLLRFTVQETGATLASNIDQQFQCNLNGGAFQNITTSSTIVKAVAAAAFADADNCTKRLSGTGTFESTGAGCTEDGLSGGNSNDIAASGNSETECGLQIVSADVVHGDVVRFRLTSPDTTITNDVVPTLTVSETTIIESDGASAGAAVALAVGAALWLVVAASVGTSEALGEAQDAGGPTIIESDGVSTGAAVVSGVSGASVNCVAESVGVSTAQSIGAAIWNALCSAIGISVSTGLSGARHGVVGASAGVAVVTGDAQDANQSSAVYWFFYGE